MTSSKSSRFSSAAIWTFAPNMLSGPEYRVMLMRRDCARHARVRLSPSGEAHSRNLLPGRRYSRPDPDNNHSGATMGISRLLALAGLVAAGTALAGGGHKPDNTLFNFDGAIGVQPLRAGGAANIVAGVNPGGVPWGMTSFRAVIRNT